MKIESMLTREYYRKYSWTPRGDDLRSMYLSSLLSQRLMAKPARIGDSMGNTRDILADIAKLFVNTGIGLNIVPSYLHVTRVSNVNPDITLSHLGFVVNLP